MYTHIPAETVFPRSPEPPGNPPRLANGTGPGMSEYRAEGELRGCLNRVVGLIGVAVAFLSSFCFYYHNLQ